MKMCNGCGMVKPLLLFGKQRQNRDGRKGTCSKCINDVNEEAKKCIVICANCHREIHAGR